MENFTSIARDLHGRREIFLEKLADVESTIMVAVADHDDMQRDRDIDAIAQASTAAAKLFTFAHDLALGLPTDSVAAQQHVQEVLAGLSVLADMTFPVEDEDDEVLA